MAPRLSDEQRQALESHPDGPVTIEDDQTHRMYVIVSKERFEKIRNLFFDDSDLSSEEMLAVARQALDDPEGWGAPGMDVYDTIETDFEDK